MLSTSIYIYLICIIIFFILGMIFQYCFFKDDKLNEKDKKEHFEGEDIPLKKVE